MTREEVRNAWLDLGYQLMVIGDRVLADAELAGLEDKPFRVRVTALALLCRSVNHYAAMRVLLESGFSVEPRTLVRQIFENMFWCGGVKVDGVDFLRQMEDDDAINKLRLGRDILDWTAKQKGVVEGQKALEDYLVALTQKGTNDKGTIALWNAACKAGMKDAYIFYRGLSNDAAHPTATTVSRHVGRRMVDDVEHVMISSVPMAIGNDEEVETIEYACGALFGVVETVNSICNTGYAEALQPLFVRYKELSKASKDTE